MRSSQVKSSQVKSSQVKSSQVKSSQVKSSQVKSSSIALPLILASLFLVYFSSAQAALNDFRVTVVLNNMPDSATWDAEFNAIQTTLNEMGVSSVNVTKIIEQDNSGISLSEIQNADLVIVDDVGYFGYYGQLQKPDTLEPNTISTVSQFHDLGKPVLFVGDDLACNGRNIPQLANLLHLSECSDNGYAGSSVVINTKNPISKGSYGVVPNFSYPWDADISSFTGASPDEIIATIDNNAPISLAYKDSKAKVAVLLPLLSSNALEVKTLFKNSVAYLMDGQVVTPLMPNSVLNGQSFQSDTKPVHLEAGEYRYYYFPKDTKKTQTVFLDVTAGDCNLYGNTFLADLTTTATKAHAKSENPDGSDENFDIKASQFGYYYVLVKGVSACDFIPPTVNAVPLKSVGKHVVHLAEDTTIGILSTGQMDVLGTLLDSKGNYVNDLDHGNHISRDYKTRVSTTFKNFLISAGDEQDTGSDLRKRRVLAAADYTLLVSPDVDAKNKPASDTGQYGLLIMERPKTTDTAADKTTAFFKGLWNLRMEDQDGTNDYLDVYVKALYPHLSNTNWGSTVLFKGVPRERQCKALNNFYLKYVLSSSYMATDGVVRKNWNSDNASSMLNGDGDIVYNSYSELNDLSVAQRGDLFAKDRTGYNHYGLYFNNTSLIDANGDANGKLNIVDVDVRRVDLPVSESWKVARPVQ